jgi:hypothetical protein
MTDKQFVGIIIGFVATALSMIAATLIALLINNSRLTGLKEALHAESKGDIGALRAETKTENATLWSELAAMRETFLTQMATYQMDIISKIAELDSRITRLER